MQSAVSPFPVCDLRDGPLEICRAVVSHCIARIVLPADRCGTFALYFGESLVAIGCWSLSKYGSGKLFPLIQSVWRCQLAAAFGGVSHFQGCHGYLPFRIRLLLPANLAGTSSQAHLFVMSLICFGPNYQVARMWKKLTINSFEQECTVRPPHKCHAGVNGMLLGLRDWTTVTGWSTPKKWTFITLIKGFTSLTHLAWEESIFWQANTDFLYIWLKSFLVWFCSYIKFIAIAIFKVRLILRHIIMHTDQNVSLPLKPQLFSVGIKQNKTKQNCQTTSSDNTSHIIITNI